MSTVRNIDTRKLLYITQLKISVTCNKFAAVFADRQVFCTPTTDYIIKRINYVINIY